MREEFRATGSTWIGGREQGDGGWFLPSYSAAFRPDLLTAAQAATPATDVPTQRLFGDVLPYVVSGASVRIVRQNSAPTIPDFPGSP